MSQDVTCSLSTNHVDRVVLMMMMMMMKVVKIMMMVMGNHRFLVP